MQEIGQDGGQEPERYVLLGVFRGAAEWGRHVDAGVAQETLAWCSVWVVT